VTVGKQPLPGSQSPSSCASQGILERIEGFN